MLTCELAVCPGVVQALPVTNQSVLIWGTPRPGERPSSSVQGRANAWPTSETLDRRSPALGSAVRQTGIRSHPGPCPCNSQSAVNENNQENYYVKSVHKSLSGSVSVFSGRSGGDPWSILLTWQMLPASGRLSL